MDEGCFLPVSSLNSLRRQALDGLEKAVISSYERSPEGYLPAAMEYSAPQTAYDTVFSLPDDPIILPQVSKGPFTEWLRDSFISIVSKAAENNASVVVNNIGWIRRFADAGIDVIGGPGLNITNKMALKALDKLGMGKSYVISPELLSKDEMEGVPLMISEHRLTPGTLRDRKGAEYSVEFDETTNKTYIFAK